MRIHLYTLMWNESKVVPFIADYWKNAGIDKVTVFNNGSTDSSVELLSKYPFVEVVQGLDTDCVDDRGYLTIKDNCWKGSDADWVIVCDFDEVPFTPYGTLKEVLARYDAQGFNLIQARCYEVVRKEFPEYDETKLLHQLDGSWLGDPHPSMHKMLCFNPSNVYEVNYTIGAHGCRPIGTNLKVATMTEDYVTIHCKHLGWDYVIDRAKTLDSRLTEEHRQKHWAFHYAEYVKDYKKEYDERMRNAVEGKNKWR